MINVIAKKTEAKDILLHKIKKWKKIENIKFVELNGAWRIS